MIVFALTVGGRAPMQIGAANVMDRLALRFDEASPIVLRGRIMCRDCELERRYGIKARCNLIGHHGAIATADGQIWNIVEQRASAALIHDERLLGKDVVVRGHLFRSARALVIDSYEMGS